jgi:hypothetical protein
LCQQLAQRWPKAVHLQSDLFYGFFGRFIPPHLPAADAQNRAAIAAACQAAQSFCRHGYSVVLDGIFGPWFLPLMCEELGVGVLDVRYVVLRVSLDEALSRVAQRGDGVAPEMVSQMHAAFADLGALSTHALDVSGLDRDQALEHLSVALDAADFCLSQPPEAAAKGI